MVSEPNIIQAVKLNRPGALHKARWMAKLLNTIKICLLEQKTITKQYEFH